MRRISSFKPSNRKYKQKAPVLQQPVCPVWSTNVRICVALFNLKTNKHTIGFDLNLHLRLIFQVYHFQPISQNEIFYAVLAFS